MITGRNYIGKTLSSENSEVLFAPHPAENSTLPEKFHIATENEVNRALELANQAFSTFKNTSGLDRAKFLESVVEEILDLGEVLINRAIAESGLSRDRLVSERERTVNQLHMFAALLREGSWVDARIDTTNADIRTMHYPLGPVAVFGASNFPFAFSTAGGDTASALAAGCPVVVKAHESHPGTNELVTTAILKAADKTGMPDGVFSSLNGTAAVGSALVDHPYTKAIGFTGSFRVGMAIFHRAANRDQPIPVYAEMSSINPVFLLEKKLDTSTEELASSYAKSVSLGSGQFCTNPGLIIGMEGESLNRFSSLLAEQLGNSESHCMLNEGIAENFRRNRDSILSQPGVKTLLGSTAAKGTTGSPSVGMAGADHLLSNRDLSVEVFGPFTLIVSCKNPLEMNEVAKALEGQLTISLIGTDKDLIEAESLISICREKAGRLLFNGTPTGVEVNHSMMHGGPYPATSDSKFTSVGALAIRRFVRPIALQDCPASLLPDELKTENPLGISRIVNGSREI